MKMLDNPVALAQDKSWSISGGKVVQSVSETPGRSSAGSNVTSILDQEAAYISVPLGRPD
jgi:hypothetical protein